MRNTTVDSLKPGPTLIEQAYDAILAAIGDGRLAPGSRLNHDDLAARMGISRQPVGQAAQRCTPRDASEGKALIAEGREAVKSGRMELLVEADVRFHLWICRVAGNPLLADTLRLYWHHLRRAMGEVLQDTERHQRIWDEHEAILDAIIARNPTEAGHRATVHAREAGKDIARAIPASPAGLGRARGVVSLSDEPSPPPAATRRHKSSP